MACEMLHEVGGSRAAGGKRLRGKVSTLFKLNQRYSTQKTVESGLGRLSIFEHVPHAVRMPPPFGIEPGINHIDRRRGRAELRLSPICFCANNTKVFQRGRSTFDLSGFAQAAVIYMGLRRSSALPRHLKSCVMRTAPAGTPTELHFAIKDAQKLRCA